jgi:hypothetical protein
MIVTATPKQSSARYDIDSLSSIFIPLLRIHCYRSHQIQKWTFFSVVFFAQLVLGLAGMPSMLMTGELHAPVPALILAGPV